MARKALCLCVSVFNNYFYSFILNTEAQRHRDFVYEQNPKSTINLTQIYELERFLLDFVEIYGSMIFLG